MGNRPITWGTLSLALLLVSACSAILGTGDSSRSAAGIARVHIGAVHDASNSAPNASAADSRAATLRSLIQDGLRDAPGISLVNDKPQRGDDAADHYTVDATIETLHRRAAGSNIEIVCRLRVSVADGRGKILVILTNGATMNAGSEPLTATAEAAIHRDVLAGAVQQLNRNLVRYLERRAESR